MARVTVEDCLEKVPNRFAMALLASKRARGLLRGATPTVKTENKPCVTALREIATGHVAWNIPVEDILLGQIPVPKDVNPRGRRR